MKECKKCNGDGYFYEADRRTPTRCDCQNRDTKTMNQVGYEKLKSSGMMWEFYPEFTGDFQTDIPQTTKTMNQAEPTLMEMITYGGAAQQVVQIEDISEAGTCVEPELLYHLLNRHGEVTLFCV